MGFLLQQAMTIIVVAVNSILRIVLITLITWISEDTWSQTFKSITNGIFVTQFFNTAFLMMLVNANFNDAGLPGGSFFSGRFYDLTEDWFVAVGYPITQTMMINCFMPFVGVATGFIIPFIMRMLDNGFSGDTYKTQKKAMQLYIDLYSGPVFLIHFRYSILFNICFVCMVYGIGIPLLFPIGCLSYVILWCVERFLVAYLFKLPPALDDKLTKNAFKILKWAVCFYLFFGYWMLTNRQVFDNYVTPIDVKGEAMRTGHAIGDFNMDQAMPLLFIGVILFVITFMQGFFKKGLKRMGFTFGGKKIEVDEDLPSFFQAVRFSDAEWYQAEIQYLEKEYGFSIESDRVNYEIDNMHPGKKTIQGCPYYLILANPAYYMAF